MIMDGNMDPQIITNGEYVSKYKNNPLITHTPTQQTWGSCIFPVSANGSGQNPLGHSWLLSFFYSAFLVAVHQEILSFPPPKYACSLNTSFLTSIVYPLVVSPRLLQQSPNCPLFCFPWPSTVCSSRVAREVLLIHKPDHITPLSLPSKTPHFRVFRG